MREYVREMDGKKRVECDKASEEEEVRLAESSDDVFMSVGMCTCIPLAPIDRPPSRQVLSLLCRHE